MLSRAGIDLEWMQGISLQRDFGEKLFGKLKDGEHYIIISQPCDLHCDCFESEPVFEVIKALEVDEKAVEYSFAKNCRSPRKLTIEALVIPVSDDGPVSKVTLFMNNHEKFQAPRIHLKENNPGNIKITLASSRFNSFSHWLGLRYSRPFLPDELDSRVKTAFNGSQLIKEASRTRDPVHSISLSIDTFGEKKSDDEYEIDILVLVKSHKTNNKSCFDKIKKESKALVDKLLTLNVVVGKFEVFYANEISVEYHQGYQRWVLDHVSIKSQSSIS